MATSAEVWRAGAYDPGGAFWKRWTPIVTAGEVAGFAVPVLVGVASASSGNAGLTLPGPISALTPGPRDAAGEQGRKLGGDFRDRRCVEAAVVFPGAGGDDRQALT